MTPHAKHRLFGALRILVCVGGLLYIGWQITWNDYVRVRDDQVPGKAVPRYRLVTEHEDRVTVLTRQGEYRDIPRTRLGTLDIERGLPSMLTRMSGWLTLLAAVVFVPVLMMCSVRFVVVMATQGIHLSIWEGFKITYAGAFLNFAMPGSTGGDLYRAYCVTRRTDKKTEAVTAVFIDRLIGLGSMMAWGGAMSLVGWAWQLNIGWAARVIGGILVAMLVGGALFFSKTVRRWLRYETILQRLPLGHHLQRIDRAVFILSHQKRRVAVAVALTVALQLIAMFSLMLVATALGMKTDAVSPYLVYLPLAMVIRAIPISIQGAGPMDWCFQRFFVDAAIGTPQQVQVLAVAVRLLELFWAIPGVLVLLTGRELPPKDFAADRENDELPVGDRAAAPAPSAPVAP